MVWHHQVYQQSIAAVCNLDWPKSKLLIQILDDSDDVIKQLLIKEEVHKWQQEGANILYRHRVIREGYKAGNLKSAMNCSYVKGYEFVAIFDADFQPTPDFLKRTVPHFEVLVLFLYCFKLQAQLGLQFNHFDHISMAVLSFDMSLYYFFVFVWMWVFFEITELISFSSIMSKFTTIRLID